MPLDAAFRAASVAETSAFRRALASAASSASVSLSMCWFRTLPVDASSVTSCHLPSLPRISASQVVRAPWSRSREPSVPGTALSAIWAASEKDVRAVVPDALVAWVVGAPVVLATATAVPPVSRAAAVTDAMTMLRFMRVPPRVVFGRQPPSGSDAEAELKPPEEIFR
ncbi:hypothetical protein SANTM175S_08837 [Streptomyces antimycoticus]